MDTNEVTARTEAATSRLFRLATILGAQNPENMATLCRRWDAACSANDLTDAALESARLEASDFAGRLDHAQFLRHIDASAATLTRVLREPDLAA